MESSVFENLMWVEKYRPKTLDDMVLSDEYRKIFNSFIDKKCIPNLILHGGPGSGKSCIARILSESIVHKSDLLYSNGSSVTGKDFVTDVIEEFVMTPSFDGNPKIVYIGEADRLTPQAQDALKEPTEIYSSNARFLFTCNELHKLSGPLKSRFHIYEFKSPSIKYVKDYIKRVLNSEKIEYTEDSVDYIISLFYPDIRFILNTISSRTINGKLSSNLEEINSDEHDLFNYSKKILLSIDGNKSKSIHENMEKVKEVLARTEVDFVSIYTELFNDINVPVWSKPIINNYCNNSRLALSGSMHFMAFLFESLKSGFEFIKAIGKVK